MSSRAGGGRRERSSGELSGEERGRRAAPASGMARGIRGGRVGVGRGGGYARRSQSERLYVVQGAHTVVLKAVPRARHAGCKSAERPRVWQFFVCVCVCFVVVLFLGRWCGGDVCMASLRRQSGNADMMLMEMMMVMIMMIMTMMVMMVIMRERERERWWGNGDDDDADNGDEDDANEREREGEGSRG